MESRRILIVEDEPAVRRMIAFNLKQAGLHVMEADDCSTALAALSELPPDLVIIDWMLGTSSGIELIRPFRRNDTSANLPLIMLTAKASEDDKRTAIANGADDYITKPFSVARLISRIESLI